VGAKSRSRKWLIALLIVAGAVAAAVVNYASVLLRILFYLFIYSSCLSQRWGLSEFM
jgi:hypothetical protein